MTILLFTDFQCPACRYFERVTLAPFLASHPDAVQLVVRHWPMDYHEYAMQAALMVECAGEQGSFMTMYRELLKYPDSLGRRTPESVARLSGVAQPESLAACVTARRHEPRILRDISAARSTGAPGTPAVVVNGLMYPVPPSRAQLEAILSRSSEPTR